jgi:hypothetical protein
MQGFDWRVPATGGDECEPATARRRGRWCSHPRLWGGCVGERVSSALSEPRPVRALARNASRQSRECATPRCRWARYRGDRWVGCAYSHRTRFRSIGALDAVDGCRTAPWHGCGPLDGAHHCGNGCNGSSPYSCVRDDASRRTWNPGEAHCRCDYHGRRLPARLYSTTYQNSRFHGMRRDASDEKEQSDPLALRHRWDISASRLDCVPRLGMFVAGASTAATRRDTLTDDNDWSPAGPQSNDGDFMTCSLEPPYPRGRANAGAISTTRNRHSIDLNRGPWNTTNPTNGT